IYTFLPLHNSTLHTMKEQHNGDERLISEIRWGGFPEATAISSLSRGTLYNLIADGLIRSRVIRRKNARGSGHRLVDLNSLLEFIENSPNEIPDEVRERNRKAARAMLEAKRRERAVDSRPAASRRTGRKEANAR